MRKIDFVSASVGEELTEQGGLAILVALIGISDLRIYALSSGSLHLARLLLWRTT